MSSFIARAVRYYRLGARSYGRRGVHPAGRGRLRVVVLTFIERSAAKPLTDKELAAIDRARELFIAGFGAW